ncbi:MAG: hypothetical protein LBI44_03555 [Oscillospiraceae bacterium]|jgi:hypothetical protein|nr:hypothetical protein [Oscillospiraceae bacterium]
MSKAVEAYRARRDARLGITPATDKVAAYRQRRDARLAARRDSYIPPDEIAGWITIKGTPVPVSESGELGGAVGEAMRKAQVDKLSKAKYKKGIGSDWTLKTELGEVSLYKDKIRFLSSEARDRFLDMGYRENDPIYEVDVISSDDEWVGISKDDPDYRYFVDGRIYGPSLNKAMALGKVALENYTLKGKEGRVARQ